MLETATRFITFADVHASAINPGSRIGDYLGDILAKLVQIGRVGRKVGAHFYILAGDLFNLKQPIRNPHSLNRVLAEVFKEYGAPIYATEGNHDLRNDSYETFDEQPLSVLYETGVLVQARDELFTLENGMSIQIRSFPFEENPDINSMPACNRVADYHIAILHLYSSPSGGSLHGMRVYSYPEIAGLGDDMFVMGHYHIDQGIRVVRHGDRDATFVNVGAISRGSLVDDNLDRIPRIGYVTLHNIVREGPMGPKVMDGATVDAKSVRLKVKPAGEVFDLEAKEDEKRRMGEAEAFVEKLRIEEDEEGGTDRLDEAIDSLDVDKDVLDSVRHYLQEADISLKDVK